MRDAKELSDYNSIYTGVNKMGVNGRSGLFSKENMEQWRISKTG